MTINPIDNDNYLFLCERDDAVELADNKGRFSLRCPLSHKCRGFRLVIASRTKEGYALALNGQEPLYETAVDGNPEADATGISDLFIGCRSHRKGILKTLGEMMLADVFLWPDKDILALDKDSAGAVTSPEHNLLMKYFTEVISRDI